MWFLDNNIVLLYHLIHDVIAFFVSEVGNNRNRLVGLGFFDNLGIINNDFGMEDFLVDTLVEVVRDCSDKHSLRECGPCSRRSGNCDRK